MKKDRQNIMGLQTKSPREFNIDRKLRPHDPLILFINGERKSKSIESWIEIIPERLWDKIYNTKEYVYIYHVPNGKEVEKLSLCSNAYSLLKKAIEKSSPDRMAALARRKNTRLILSRVYSQLS